VEFSDGSKKKAKRKQLSGSRSTVILLTVLVLEEKDMFINKFLFVWDRGFVICCCNYLGPEMICVGGGLYRGGAICQAQEALIHPR
jgi:hypothetical protein